MMTKKKEPFTPPGSYVAVGQVYGRLTVLEMDTQDVTDKPKWLCQCSCGIKKLVATPSLRTGSTQSCGCLRKGFEPRKTFERAKSYAAWSGMKSKCTNPKNKSYPKFGALGIRYDPRWESFEEFHKDMGDGPIDHYFCRVKDKGHFQADNCVWVKGRGPKRTSVVGAEKGEVNKGQNGWKFPLKINAEQCLVDSNNEHIISLNGSVALNIGRNILEALNGKGA